MEIIGRSCKEVKGLHHTVFILYCAYSDLEILSKKLEGISSWEYYTKDKYNLCFTPPKTLNNATYEIWRNAMLVAEASYLCIENNKEVQESLLPLSTTIKVKYQVDSYSYLHVKDVFDTLVGEE